MSIVVSCLAIALVVTVVVATDNNQTSNNLEYNDSRPGRGLRFGWNTMDGAKRSCVGINGRPGVCMGHDQCTNMNGKSVGKCFPFDSCCSITPNSCGGHSGYSTAYFQSPDKFQEMCSYKINIRRNVCQLRIDFEKFSLSQPTKRHSESAYYCEHDEFTMLTKENTRINLPMLCGENSGQHVYVPIDQSTSLDFKSRQHVTLRFELIARDESFTEPEPLWKMKISQLECPSTHSSWLKIKDITRQVWDWEKEEREIVEKSKYSLAPDGCLQYFTDQKGSFESFNYNRGLGHYMANLNYAVCFKRQYDSCGIRYEAVRFQMAYRQNLTGFTDRDCDTAAGPQTTTVRPFTTTRTPTTARNVTGRPTTTTGAQPTTTGAPPTTTGAPPTTTGAPPASSGAPPATTGAPPATTGAPPATTRAPPATTRAPPATTRAPPATTDAPPATTDQPTAATTDATDESTVTTDAPATTVVPATMVVPRRSAESVAHAIFFVETGLTRADPAAREARRRTFGSVRGDYLVVPDGVYSGGQRAASKYCGSSMRQQANHVTTVAQGPFFVAFVSDDYSNPSADLEKGFKINYSLANSEC